MTSGLWFDFIVGSSIILIPLAILIITIARDLDSKYEGLSLRIAKLNSAYSQIMDDQDVPPINSNATELDEQDNKLIRDLAKEIGAKNCIKGEKIESTIYCGHALALKKVMSIRMAEQVLLANKIKFFRLYSVTAYFFIIISMSILPVLVYAGFNWRWK